MRSSKTAFFLNFTALGIAALIAMSIGRYPIPLSALGHILFSCFSGMEKTGDLLTQPAMVLWSIRLPRILMAIMTGAALSTAGVILQGLFRNPLVSPGIIGVTSGANFGAALALLFSGPLMLIQCSAFVWGLIAVFITFQVGKQGDNSVTTLVLAGVIVSALFIAGISFIKCKADPYNQLPAIVFWTMGSFNSITWMDAATSSVLIIISLVLCIFFRCQLNPLALGDEEAMSLGVNVSGTRKIFIFLATLMVAAATASCGSIGWVGLIIPHMARMIVGADHNILVPFSALLGGLFMLCMDTLVRALPGGEIPVGILTAVIGAPCFGYLLIQKGKAGWHG